VLRDCAFGDGIVEIVKCLPIGQSSRFKLKWKQMRIKGNVISCNKERFSVGDDESEDLFVASDADEYSLLGSKAEGLILELATISVDGTEGSDWWNSTDIGTKIEKHFKEGFGRITT
jgi:hypothetical protein